MKPNSDNIPPGLLMSITIHILIGWGFLYLVKTATVHLSHNAYLALIPASVVIMVILWFIYDLARIFPHQGISIIYQKVFGKLIGKIIGIVFILYVLLFMTISIRDTHLMVQTYFFKRTPFFLVTAASVLIALYMGLKGIKSIGRLASFMLLPPLLLMLLLILLGLSNINLIMVQPVLAGSPLQWLQACSGLTLVLLPGLATVLYLPFIKQPQTIKKVGLFSLATVVPLFFLSLFGAIGVFGPELIRKKSWPVVEFFHVIDYPYLLLEQAGLFFLITWYPFVFVALCQGLFIIGNEAHLIYPQIKRNRFILAAFILLYLGANLPIDVITIHSFLRRFQSLLSLSFMGILLITWLTARLRLGKGPKDG
jgi:spore germination protein (amino acid permease)